MINCCKTKTAFFLVFGALSDRIAGARAALGHKQAKAAARVPPPENITMNTVSSELSGRFLVCK